MKTRKLLWYLIGGVSGTAALLFAALVVHLVFIYKGKQNDFRQRQLGRIDFKESLPPQTASSLKTFVLQIPGVDGAYINDGGSILVYSYDPSLQQGSNITYAVTKQYGCGAHPYKVTRSQLSQGCPAGYEKSPITKLAMNIAKRLQ